VFRGEFAMMVIKTIIIWQSANAVTLFVVGVILAAALISCCLLLFPLLLPPHGCDCQPYQ
jgi:hypothetical protein